MLATFIYVVGMITMSPVLIKLGTPKVTHDNIYDYYPPPPPPPPPIHIWKDYRGNLWWNPPPTEDYDGDGA